MENTVTTPVVDAATNETLVGSLASYFRWNQESREYEINARIDPAIETDSWHISPSLVYDRLCNPSYRLTVGHIVYALNDASLRARRLQEQRDKTTRDAQHAIAIIGERLIQEAKDRGWCNEFDTIIDEVNSLLPDTMQLPTRVKRVERRVRIRGDVYVDRTVWVDENDDADDPDCWYEDEDSDYALGSDWADEVLHDEFRSNGFDNTECEAL